MNGKWRQTKGEHHKNRATFANMSMVDGILDGVSRVFFVVVRFVHFACFLILSPSETLLFLALSFLTRTNTMYTLHLANVAATAKTTTEKYPIQAMEWLQ